MPVDLKIIDSHCHTGVQHVSWGWDRIRPLLLEAGITGAAPIPPVEDIYNRFDPDFTDTPAWKGCRRRAHQYLGIRRQGLGHILPLEEMTLLAPPIALDPARPDQDVGFEGLPFNHDEPKFVMVNMHACLVHSV